MVAVDVGYGQLHERLRADPRVEVLERTNVRDLEPGDVGAPADLVVADLSFISLRTVLPAVLGLAAPGADLVLLVKPQFEAGREEASRGRGVITDPAVWRRVLDEVAAALEHEGAAIMGAMASPLTGADGNVEFLLHARTGATVGARRRRARSTPRSPKRGPLMAAVGLVLHHERSQAADLAREAAAWLQDEGHEVRLPQPDADIAGLASLGCDDDALGDRARRGREPRWRRHDAAHRRPGRRARRADHRRQRRPAGLPHRHRAGGHARRHRALPRRRAHRRGADAARPCTWSGRRAADEEHLAFNEAVLEKTPMGHTVRLAVEVDDQFFTTYAADGLIVATPTGSTAYAFSARGPIVAPTHRALLLTPVSPHMLFDRTLVLDPAARLRLVVQGHRAATLSVDGRNLGELGEGDHITCTAAERSARLVTFGDRGLPVDPQGQVRARGPCRRVAAPAATADGHLHQSVEQPPTRRRPRAPG